jgi:hypothetical protein
MKTYVLTSCATAGLVTLGGMHGVFPSVEAAKDFVAGVDQDVAIPADSPAWMVYVDEKDKSVTHFTHAGGKLQWEIREWELEPDGSAASDVEILRVAKQVVRRRCQSANSVYRGLSNLIDSILAGFDHRD